MNQNMNFSQFCNELIRALTPMFPEQTSISIQTIPKNNNVSFEALIIHEPGTNISPTIYLEDYYTLYRDGTSLDELCEIICDVFLEVRLNHPIDPSFFTDFVELSEFFFKLFFGKASAVDFVLKNAFKLAVFH